MCPTPVLCVVIDHESKGSAASVRHADALWRAGEPVSVSKSWRATLAVRRPSFAIESASCWARELRSSRVSDGRRKDVGWRTSIASILNSERQRQIVSRCGFETSCIRCFVRRRAATRRGWGVIHRFPASIYRLVGDKPKPPERLHPRDLCATITAIGWQRYWAATRSICILSLLNKQESVVKG